MVGRPRVARHPANTAAQKLETRVGGKVLVSFESAADGRRKHAPATIAKVHGSEVVDVTYDVNWPDLPGATSIPRATQGVALPRWRPDLRPERWGQ